MLAERTTTQELSVFRSEEGKAAYTAAYDALLALWPVPHESIWLETPFGVTHALVAGPEDGRPLVLLPAVSNSAASWFLNIEGLSKTRRVYALDVIGDAGKSVLQRRLESRPEIAQWLAAVFAALDLDRPAVAGHSYGGWLALNLALYAPQHVGRLVLIAPAASLRPFRIWTQVGLRLPHLPQWFPFQPSAESILQYMVTGDYRLNERFVELMEMTTRHTKTHLLFPTVFGDDELRQIKAPTLLVLGEEEIIYDPRAALARARRLIPDLKATLVPDASHLLTMQWPAVVNGRVLEFLGQE
jgi:pimeloyl-ACP methyl ester carboxylesterase